MRDTAADIVAFTRELLGDSSLCNPSNEAIEQALDFYSQDYLQASFYTRPTLEDGDVVYKHYYAPSFLEGVVLQRSGYQELVEDSDYILDIYTGKITLTESEDVLYISCREHDPHAAAADLLELYIQQNAQEFVSLKSGRLSISNSDVGARIRDKISALRERSKHGSEGYIGSFYRDDYLP